MGISSKEITHFTRRQITTQQAWAAYLRQRFRENCLAHTMREFDLTEGRARGAVYGTITQRTIDEILAHRNGGPTVALAVEATAWGISSRELISAWIEIERGRIEDDRKRSDAEDRRMVEMVTHLTDNVMRRNHD